MDLVPRPTEVENAYHEGWRAAVGLARALHQGAALPTEPTSLVLGPEESFVCTVQLDVAAYYGLDVELRSSFFALGSTWTGLAATAGASMLWNRHQRNNAQAQAAAQWRALGRVPVQVATRRIVIPLDNQLRTFFLPEGIVAFEPMYDDYAIILHANGFAPLAMRGPGAPYLAVILHTLLRGVPPRQLIAGSH